MPIVPKGTSVTAIPWELPEADWKFPTGVEYDSPVAWMGFINWSPGPNPTTGEHRVWWVALQKITKEDYQFDILEARCWTGASGEARLDEYTFVVLERNAEYAGFIVENVNLITTNENKEWRDRWRVTLAQEEGYRAWLQARKLIQAIKQFRQDRLDTGGDSSLRFAKDAIDELNGLMRLEATLKP